MEKTTFGAGCFWHVEEEFRQMPGVLETRVGYMGGAREKPTYQEVCSHGTGHAEVVEVTFDPALVSYDALLRIFWDCHDPTQLNRQGPDIGTNYRSAIFFHSREQEEKALRAKEVLERSRRYHRPIVTEITPASTFWPVEEYHQQYLAKREKNSCGW